MRTPRFFGRGFSRVMVPVDDYVPGTMLGFASLSILAAITSSRLRFCDEEPRHGPSFPFFSFRRRFHSHRSGTTNIRVLMHQTRNT